MVFMYDQDLGPDNYFACYAGIPVPCPHTYQEMDSEICGLCGGYTHKTDWTYQHELHKDWIASGKAVSQGWTSI
jgi:hypothetical protein